MIPLRSWVAAVWFVALAVGCGESRLSESRPRNLVLVTIGSLRADHLSAYGYHRETSGDPEAPGYTLDRLAEEGTRFSNAFAVRAETLPSLASLFTGMYPQEHGVWTNGQVLPDEVETLAETMREAGYSTAAFSAWPFLAEDSGVAQGFDKFTTEADAMSLVGKALVWLERERYRQRREVEGPGCFLWLHLAAPHRPYDPPDHTGSMLEPLLRDRPGETADFLRRFGTGEPGGASLEVLDEAHRRGRALDQEAHDQVVALYDGEVALAAAQLRHFLRRYNEDPRAASLTIRLREVLPDRVIQDLAREWEQGNPLRVPREHAAMARRIVEEVVDTALEAPDLKRMDADPQGCVQVGMEASRRAFVDDPVHLTDTLLVVTADHGEDLGERHGAYLHGPSVYDSALRVPLIVRYPRFQGGVKEGRVTPQVVDGTDLAPTLAGLMGVRHPRGSRGRDLSLALLGLDEFPVGRAFAQQLGGITTVRDRRWRLVTNPGPPSGSYPVGMVELYDHENDPSELRNVSSLHPGARDSLIEALEAWRAGLRSSTALPSGRGTPQWVEAGCPLPQGDQ